MLSFRPASVNDRREIEGILVSAGSRRSEISFCNLFIWESQLNIEVCVEGGMLFVRRHTDCGYFYHFPVGKGDIKWAIKAICETEGGRPPVFTALSEELVDCCGEIFKRHGYEFFDARDWADYIYLAEDLICLPGKELHSKRNFINRFCREYAGRWVYEDIDGDKLGEIKEFNRRWCDENIDDRNLFLRNELCAIELGLDNMKEIGMFGGLIRVDGRVAAFTLASEMLPDTADIHAEKADRSYSGIYAVINNQFARNRLSGYTYINREEDMGIEGLRRAKLSYKPHRIQKIFHAAVPDPRCPEVFSAAGLHAL